MSRSFEWKCLSLVTILILATLTGAAQMPGRWLTQQKFAPVPNPEEEYWNTVVNGKLYMMGGGWNLEVRAKKGGAAMAQKFKYTVKD